MLVLPKSLYIVVDTKTATAYSIAQLDGSCQIAAGF